MLCIERVECRISISTSKCYHSCYCFGYNGGAELRSCQKATYPAVQGKHTEEWMHMTRSKTSFGNCQLNKTGLLVIDF